MAIDQQATATAYLQGTSPTAGTTVTGNGTPVEVNGYNGAQMIEIRETAGGTATVILEGTYDPSPSGVWYPVGYQQVDNVQTPARSVSSISVAANTAHVYQVLDAYRWLQARVSAISSAKVMVRVYLVPA